MPTINFQEQDKLHVFTQQQREQIENSYVVVVGIGAVGCACVQQLIRTGIKNVLLIDGDVVAETNLPRQTLYGEDDVGKPKVYVARKRLLEVRKETHIEARKSMLLEENVEKLLANADLVMDCSDNFTARKIIEKHCSKNNIRWIHASATNTYGELLVYGITDNEVNYSSLIAGKIEQGGKQLGILCAASVMVGTLQATLGFRVLLGDTKDMEHTLFRLNAWSLAIERIQLR